MDLLDSLNQELMRITIRLETDMFLTPEERDKLLAKVEVLVERRNRVNAVLRTSASEKEP